MTLTRFSTDEVGSVFWHIEVHVYVRDIVVERPTFAISFPDEFLCYSYSQKALCR